MIWIYLLVALGIIIISVVQYLMCECKDPANTGNSYRNQW